jgi:hypothetical protein
VWDGKLIWGRLTHSRVIGVLANPSYAGTYVFGRYLDRLRDRSFPNLAARFRNIFHNETYANQNESCADARSQPGKEVRSYTNGAHEEIRTPDPQIRSLGQTIEIIEVGYRKRAAARQNQHNSAASGGAWLP